MKPTSENTETDTRPAADSNPADIPATPSNAATRENEPAPDPASEVEHYREQALRSRAELDNYRKRMAREKEEAIRYANAGLIERLLPIIDSFELGLRAAEGAKDASAIHEGMSLVHRQLGDFLKDHGVEGIDAEGKPFDPNFHEAVGHEASETVPDGHVAKQMRKGYKLRERLIRPAMVVVSKGSA